MSLRLQVRQAAGEIPYRLGGGRLRTNSLSVLMYHAVTRDDLRDRKSTRLNSSH